jgi:transposase-like protein
MTGKMKRFYETYSDVVFMDATYKTNRSDMALTVFSGVNCDGRNTIFGFALVK